MASAQRDPRTRALRRRLGLEPNRLRRPADHIESAIIVTLLFVFLLGAPLLGVLVGLSSYETSLRTEQAQADRHPATAQLTADAPAPAPAIDNAAAPTEPAAAKWTDAGTVHFGTVRAQPGTKAGTKVPIWVDGTGRPVPEQRSHLATVAHAVVMGGASVFGVAFTVWLSGLVVRRVFIHRQLAAWDADWSAAEPKWTGRTGS